MIETNDSKLKSPGTAENPPEVDLTRKFITELLLNKLMYFWNVYIFPTVYNKEARADAHHFMKNLLSIQEGEKVLELGSSLPAYQEYSGDVGEQGLFVALDLHLQIQKRAKKMLRKDAVVRGADSFLEKLLTANGGKLPFADETFDVVVTNNYNGDSFAMLQEATRVLRAGGGRLGFSFDDRLSAAVCHKYCEHFGLEVSKIKNVSTQGGRLLGCFFVAVKR